MTGRGVDEALLNVLKEKKTPNQICQIGIGGQIKT